MTTFDDRDKGFESKYKRDQETEFKVVARRNKLLGLWLAEKMGLSESEAQAYAKEVVASDFEEAGHEDVVRKVMADIGEKGLTISEKDVRAQMEDLLTTAHEQISKG